MKEARFYQIKAKFDFSTKQSRDDFALIIQEIFDDLSDIGDTMSLNIRETVQRHGIQLTSKHKLHNDD